MIEIGPEDAATLHDAYERILKLMEGIEPVIRHLPETPARDQYLGAHASVIVDIFSQLRAPLVLRYPELDAASAGGATGYRAG